MCIITPVTVVFKLELTDPSSRGPFFQDLFEALEKGKDEGLYLQR